jgi:squalene synthase HpnC
MALRRVKPAHGQSAPQSTPNCARHLLRFAPVAMSVDHYENFPVASVLCPPRLRPAVAAIYWYARTADDLADEGNEPPAHRLQQLAKYKADLHSTAAGGRHSGAWPGVFDPLEPVLREHRLPTSLLEDLLSAFEQDVTRQRYTDRADLLDYCRRSANPVGRLLLHLYGVGDAQALRQSDAICTALQLINFWQDLSIDLPRGRLYLPLADCDRLGVAPEVVMQGQDTPAIRALVADACGWARGLMREGAPLVHRLPGRAGWELRLVVQGGLRILDKIAAMDHAAIRRRPRLRWWDALPMLWCACRM